MTPSIQKSKTSRCSPSDSGEEQTILDGTTLSSPEGNLNSPHDIQQDRRSAGNPLCQSIDLDGAMRPCDELKQGFNVTPIQKRHLVVVSGAGISAESGLGTFRGAYGRWQEVSIQDVATAEAWHRNPERVLNFYNQRRRDVRRANPNEAHYALVQLEKAYDVTIITQNVDDLHERAGSSRVIHLHGEIMKAESSVNPDLVVPWHDDITLEDRCQLGGQLRPNIVLFGEKVHHLQDALSSVENADLLLVVGTSLVVYPAAALLTHSRPDTSKYLVDPMPNRSSEDGFKILNKPASIGIPILTEELLALANPDLMDKKID